MLPPFRLKREGVWPLVTPEKRSLMVLPSDLPVSAIQGNKKHRIMRFLHRHTMTSGNGRRTVGGLYLMKYLRSNELTGLTLLKGR